MTIQNEEPTFVLILNDSEYVAKYLEQSLAETPYGKGARIHQAQSREERASATNITSIAKIRMVIVTE